MKVFHAHAITREVKLYHGDTGPLELLYFLRYELPETAGTTYGRFVIEIYPKIAKPDPAINGEIRCYFFGNIDASSCVFDDQTYEEKTVITMYTPELRTFRASEIPLTVTTSGIDNQMKGITLVDLEQRYKFHIAMYRQDRNDNYPNPTEVHVCEFIPSLKQSYSGDHASVFFLFFFSFFFSFFFALIVFFSAIRSSLINAATKRRGVFNSESGQRTAIKQYSDFKQMERTEGLRLLSQLQWSVGTSNGLLFELCIGAHPVSL